jgi:hypothetical protein
MNAQQKCYSPHHDVGLNKYMLVRRRKIEQAVKGDIYWTAVVVSFFTFQKVALLVTSD